MQEQESQCPICETPAGKVAPSDPKGGNDAWNCPRCGEFELTIYASANIEQQLARVDGGFAILSHYIRQSQKLHNRPVLRPDSISKLLETSVIPDPPEQTNNFIVWLGLNTRGGQNISRLSVNKAAFPAIMGARDVQESDFVVSYLETEKLYDQTSRMLTMKGWTRFQELKESVDLPMRGFMAMKFGDQGLDQVYEQCFLKAAKRAGFDLKRVDEQPRAGLIDDQMRIDIRRSRFVIADLSGDSEGAYWEAGYAEALGKPVIHACRHDQQSKVHFDTNHHLTVQWDPNFLESAEDKLVATIRASLPEARQEDLE